MSKIKLLGNNYYMNKNEYLSKIKSLIINRVKYHAPNIVSDNIDYALLDAVGIDINLPIFIYTKPLDRLFYRAFFEVKKSIEFNLILTSKPIINEKRLSQIKNCYLILEEEMGGSLKQTLEALNINYLSHSNFVNKMEGEYISVNNKKIEFDYTPYFYSKNLMEDGVIFKIQNFLLNGKNFILNFINTKKTVKNVNFEINIPLPRGYYFFKKCKDYVEIENLTSKQKAYFNYNFKNSKIYFSNMSGIESCTFACIHLQGEINLLPLEQRRCFFNYGDEKFCMYSPKDMLSYFEISQEKMNEVFDIKIISHDKQYDNLFNVYLPRKIWEMWQKFDVDEKSENDWIKMKKQIVKKVNNGLQINEEFKGLKEVKIFRNYKWKRVFIVHNKMKYLFADKVKYYNYTLLTNEIFNKNNEIYLSFADS